MAVTIDHQFLKDKKKQDTADKNRKKVRGGQFRKSLGKKTEECRSKKRAGRKTEKNRQKHMARPIRKKQKNARDKNCAYTAQKTESYDCKKQTALFSTGTAGWLFE